MTIDRVVDIGKIVTEFVVDRLTHHPLLYKMRRSRVGCAMRTKATGIEFSSSKFRIMTKNLLLHVGAPKTGSTALQNLMTMHNGSLAQYGVVYPLQEHEIEAARQAPEAYLGSGNAADLVSSIVSASRPSTDLKSETVKKLENRICASKAHEYETCVLSSENLFWLGEHQWSIVKDVLGNIWPSQDLRIYPVIVVRNLIEHGLSWWAHLVRRHGYSGAREVYLQAGHADQLAAVEKLARVFGKENVIVVNYADARFVLKAMLCKVGVTLDDTFFDCVGEVRVNRTLPLEAIEVLRSCATGLPSESWITDFEGRKIANELFADCGEILEAGGSGGTPLSAFPETVAHEITRSLHDKYAEALANFNAVYNPVGGPLQIGDDILLKDATGAADSTNAAHFRWLPIFEKMMRQMLETSSRYADQRARIAQAKLVQQSGIFDHEYYMAQIAERSPSTGIGRFLTADMALTHFTQVGWKHGLKPCPYFDPLWYQQHYPDLAKANPVEHYIKAGALEGRTPSPLIPAKIAAEYKTAANIVSVLCGTKPRELRHALAGRLSTNESEAS